MIGSLLMEAKHQSFLKMLAVVTPAGIGATKSPGLFNEIVAMPVWGVPVTVFGAAATGAALSLCFGDSVPTRRKLWGQLIAACIFGTASAVLLADALNWDWAQDKISMFALVCAALIRWFLQPTIDRCKQLISNLKFNLKFLKSDTTKGDES